jgi:SAM-dependent methyltransferase
MVATDRLRTPQPDAPDPDLHTTSSGRDQVACLLCREAMIPWMVVPGDWRRPDHPGRYPLYWCRSCQFGQLQPRPARDQIPSFYQLDSYYTHDGESASPGPERLTLLDRLRIKLAFRNDRGVEVDEFWMQGRLSPGARVCDLGCGNGNLLARLSRLGHDVIGVEPDPSACEASRQQGYKVLQGAAEELPDEIRGEQYDCVVMWHVLEHCLDPILAISNAASLLAARGSLIIITPNNEAKGLARAGILWPWLDVPRHLNFFTGKSLQSICTNLGLSVQSIEYQGYTRQFHPEWIRTERRIRDVFSAKAGRSSNLPSAFREFNSWSLLFSTAWSSDRLKCDAVRVIVGRPSEGNKTTDNLP